MPTVLCRSQGHRYLVSEYSNQEQQHREILEVPLPHPRNRDPVLSVITLPRFSSYFMGHSFTQNDLLSEMPISIKNYLATLRRVDSTSKWYMTFKYLECYCSGLGHNFSFDLCTQCFLVFLSLLFMSKRKDRLVPKFQRVKGRQRNRSWAARQYHFLIGTISAPCAGPSLGERRWHDFLFLGHLLC